jgi:hypothetical protein
MGGQAMHFAAGQHPNPSYQADFSYKIRLDIKPTDLATWDGNEKSFLDWAERLDELASSNATLLKQLGEVMPTRLTGNALQWWRVLPLRDRAQANESWVHLRNLITSSYLGKRWRENQWLNYHAIGFRLQGRTTETPSEFFWRKIRIRRIIHPAERDDPHYDAKEVISVMENMPRPWPALLQTETIHDVAELVSRVRDIEDQLIAQSDIELLDPAAMYRKLTKHVESLIKEGKRNVNSAAVSATRTPSGFRSATSHTYPFSDFRSKKKPPRPCRHCGNPLHWDNDCTSYKDNPTKARPYTVSAATTAYLAAYSAVVELEDVSLEDLAIDDSQDVSDVVEDELEFNLPDDSYHECYWHEVQTATLSKDRGNEYAPEPSTRRPPGMAALGTDALKIRCHVNSRKEKAIEAIGDSGAAITLVSKQYLESLVYSKPRWRKGLKLNLIHITGEASCLGYVKLDLHLTSQLGPVLLTGVEAYVVDGMRSELLIGEDTQRAWQLHTNILSLRISGRYTISYG